MAELHDIIIEAVQHEDGIAKRGFALQVTLGDGSLKEITGDLVVVLHNVEKDREALTADQPQSTNHS